MGNKKEPTHPLPGFREEAVTWQETVKSKHTGLTRAFQLSVTSVTTHTHLTYTSKGHTFQTAVQ